MKQERAETKRVVDGLAETRRELLVRKEKIVQELASLRALIPAAMGAVLGVAAAAEAAITLNTSFQATPTQLTSWSRIATMGKVNARFD